MPSEELRDRGPPPPVTRAKAAASSPALDRRTRGRPRRDGGLTGSAPALPHRTRKKGRCRGRPQGDEDDEVDAAEKTLCQSGLGNCSPSRRKSTIEPETGVKLGPELESYRHSCEGPDAGQDGPSPQPEPQAEPGSDRQGATSGADFQQNSDSPFNLTSSADADSNCHIPLTSSGDDGCVAPPPDVMQSLESRATPPSPSDKDPLSPFFHQLFSEGSVDPLNPNLGLSNKCLQQCAFCYRGEVGSLGQGRLMVFGPTPGYIPLHIQNRRTSSDRDSDCHDHCYRGNQAPVLCASPDPDGASSEFLRQVGPIGLPPDIDVQSLFDPTGQCCAHLQCAAWSEGVRRGEGQSLLYVDKAIDVGSTQVCVLCHRLGASLRCQRSGCGRSYHFPCATAVGALQDWDQRLTLCTRHTQTASSECVSCSSVDDVTGMLMCCCCGNRYHGSCLDPPLLPSFLSRAGWQCPKCQVCQSFRVSGDGVLRVCDCCQKAHHSHCVAHLQEHTRAGVWECQSCRVSRKVDGQSVGNWVNTPTQCQSCDGAPGDASKQKCVRCSRRIHSHLTGGEGPDSEVICSTCKSRDIDLIPESQTTNSPGATHGGSRSTTPSLPQTVYTVSHCVTEPHPGNEGSPSTRSPEHSQSCLLEVPSSLSQVIPEVPLPSHFSEVGAIQLSPEPESLEQSKFQQHPDSTGLLQRDHQSLELTKPPSGPRCPTSDACESVSTGTPHSSAPPAAHASPHAEGNQTLALLNETRPQTCHSHVEDWLGSTSTGCDTITTQNQTSQLGPPQGPLQGPPQGITEPTPESLDHVHAEHGGRSSLEASWATHDPLCLYKDTNPKPHSCSPCAGPGHHSPCSLSVSPSTPPPCPSSVSPTQCLFNAATGHHPVCTTTPSPAHVSEVLSRPLPSRSSCSFQPKDGELQPGGPAVTVPMSSLLVKDVFFPKSVCSREDKTANPPVSRTIPSCQPASPLPEDIKDVDGLLLCSSQSPSLSTPGSSVDVGLGSASCCTSREDGSSLSVLPISAGALSSSPAYNHECDLNSDTCPSNGSTLSRSSPAGHASPGVISCDSLIPSAHLPTIGPARMGDNLHVPFDKTGPLPTRAEAPPAVPTGRTQSAVLGTCYTTACVSNSDTGVIDRHDTSTQACQSCTSLDSETSSVRSEGSALPFSAAQTSSVPPRPTSVPINHVMSESNLVPGSPNTQGPESSLSPGTADQLRPEQCSVLFRPKSSLGPGPLSPPCPESLCRMTSKEVVHDRTPTEEDDQEMSPIDYKHEKCSIKGEVLQRSPADKVQDSALAERELQTKSFADEKESHVEVKEEEWCSDEDKVVRALLEEKMVEVKMSAEEEQEGTSAEEEPEKTSAEKELERTFAEEDHEMASVEEKQESSAEEEPERSSVEEKPKISAEVEQEITSAEEDHGKTSAEEEEKTSAEEEQAKNTLEEMQAEPSYEEEQAKISAEEEQEKTTFEEMQTETYFEEEQAKTSAEQELERTSAEEEHKMASPEEEPERTSAEEEPERTPAEEEHKMASAEEEPERTSAEEEPERTPAEEEHKMASAEEEPERTSAEEEPERTPAEEEHKMASAEEEPERTSAEEEPERTPAEEEHKMASAEEEPERTSAEEEPERTPAEEEHKMASAEEEPERTPAEEEHKVASAEEEPERTSAEEEPEMTPAEEEHKMSSAEEEPERTSAEEEHKMASAEEEPERTSTEEEQERTPAEEEHEMASAEEEPERKSVEEEQGKTSFEEEQERTSAEEEQERSSAEEEQEKTSAEEELERTFAEEEQEKTSAEEEHEKTSAAEEALERTTVEEEQERTTAKEEQEKTSAEEQERTTAKEEQDKTSAEEQERTTAKEEQEKNSAEEEREKTSAEEQEKTSAEVLTERMPAVVARDPAVEEKKMANDEAKTEHLMNIEESDEEEHHSLAPQQLEDSKLTLPIFALEATKSLPAFAGALSPSLPSPPPPSPLLAFLPLPSTPVKEVEEGVSVISNSQKHTQHCIVQESTARSDEVEHVPGKESLTVCKEGEEEEEEEEEKEEKQEKEDHLVDVQEEGEEKKDKESVPGQEEAVEDKECGPPQKKDEVEELYHGAEEEEAQSQEKRAEAGFLPERVQELLGEREEAVGKPEDEVLRMPDVEEQLDSQVLELDPSLDMEVMQLMNSSPPSSLLQPSSFSLPPPNCKDQGHILGTCSSRALDDLAIRLRQSPFSTEASPETSPFRAPASPPPHSPPSPPLSSFYLQDESLPLPESPPTMVLPLTPKIGMGKPAISRRKFSPGRSRGRQSSWWSSRRAVSPPSSSQDSLSEGSWDSPKPRSEDPPLLWGVKVGRGSGSGRRRSRGGSVRGGRGRSRLKALDYVTLSPGSGEAECQQLKDEEEDEEEEEEEEEKEENSMHNTVVMFSTSDHFTLKQDVCVVCGSFGRGPEGRLLACSQCGQCYHPYCVNVKVTRVILTKGWRCLECTVCEACGKSSDPGRLLLCDDCDISYHTYCLDPPLHTVPKGSWKCKWCVWCVQCGATTPGVRCDWQSNYSHCGPCASLSSCPACQRRYNPDELILQCQQCDRWLHAVCQGLTSEDHVEAAADEGFKCLLCTTFSRSPYGRTDSTYMAQVLPKIKELDIKTYTQDGVCLTEYGLSHLQSLVEPLSSPRRYRRSKPKLKLRIINQNSVSVLQTPVEPETPTELDHSGDFECENKSDSSPERDHAHNDDVTKELEVTGGKKRKRRPYRPGIGGFMVRQRGGKSGLRFSGKGSVDSLACPKEDVVIETLDTTEQEKVKKRYRKKKTKLEETFPSYLQDAFFGRDLLDRSFLVKRTGDGLAHPQSGSDPPSSKVRALMTNRKQGTLAALKTGPLTTSHEDQSPEARRGQRLVQDENLDAILSPELDKMVTEGEILSKLYNIPELEGKDVEEVFTAVLSPNSLHKQHTPLAAIKPQALHTAIVPARHPPVNGLMGVSLHTPGPAMPGSFRVLSSETPVSLSTGGQVSGEVESDSMTATQRSTMKWEKEEALGDLATVAPVLYCNTNFPQLREHYPDWSNRVKQIAKLWRKASAQDRAPYVQKARDNRAAQRINKVQLSNETLKCLPPSLPTPGPYEPVSMETELMFNDPMKPKESEQEQEWKLRQQQRQKSKQLAKMEATQKLEQVKNEQLQRHQLSSNQQEASGDSSPSFRPHPLQADDVFLRPQAPPPSGFSLPQSSSPSSPLAQTPSSPQMFSSPTSRPSSPWDPYCKSGGAPRPASSPLGSPLPTPDNKTNELSWSLGPPTGQHQNRLRPERPSGPSPDHSSRQAIRPETRLQGGVFKAPMPPLQQEVFVSGGHPEAGASHSQPSSPLSGLDSPHCSPYTQQPGTPKLDHNQHSEVPTQSSPQPQSNTPTLATPRPDSGFLSTLMSSQRTFDPALSHGEGPPVMDQPGQSPGQQQRNDLLLGAPFIRNPKPAGLSEESVLPGLVGLSPGHMTQGQAEDPAASDRPMSLLPQMGDSEEKLRQRQRLRQLLLRQQQQKSALRPEKLSPGPAAGNYSPQLWFQNNSASPSTFLLGRPPPPYPGTVRPPSSVRAPALSAGAFTAEHQKVFQPTEAPCSQQNHTPVLVQRTGPRFEGRPPVGLQDFKHSLLPAGHVLGHGEVELQTRSPADVTATPTSAPSSDRLHTFPAPPQAAIPRPLQQHRIMGQPYIELRHRVPENRFRLVTPPRTVHTLHRHGPGSSVEEMPLGQQMVLLSGTKQFEQQRHLQTENAPVGVSHSLEEHIEDSAVKDLEDVEVKDLVDLNLNLDADDGKDLDLGANDLHLDDFLLCGKFDLIAYADPELDMEEELDLGEPLEDRSEPERKTAENQARFTAQVKQEVQAGATRDPATQYSCSRLPCPPGPSVPEDLASSSMVLLRSGVQSPAPLAGGQQRNFGPVPSVRPDPSSQSPPLTRLHLLSHQNPQTQDPGQNKSKLLLLEEQPLLLQDLLDQERQEQQKQIQMQALIRQKSTTEAEFPDPNLDPIMKAKMVALKGINKVMTQSNLSPIINRVQQPPPVEARPPTSMLLQDENPLLLCSSPAAGPLSDPPTGLSTGPAVGPPSCPRSRNLNFVNETQRRQWLAETQQLLLMQQRLLEEQINAHRETRKALCAKQRSMKKTGRALAEEETTQLRHVTEQQGALQKQLEQIRKQQKDDTELLEEYQLRLQRPQPHITKTTPSHTAELVPSQPPNTPSGLSSGAIGPRHNEPNLQHHPTKSPSAQVPDFVGDPRQTVPGLKGAAVDESPAPQVKFDDNNPFSEGFQERERRERLQEQLERQRVHQVDRQQFVHSSLLVAAPEHSQVPLYKQELSQEPPLASGSPPSGSPFSKQGFAGGPRLLGADVERGRMSGSLQTKPRALSPSLTRVHPAPSAPGGSFASSSSTEAPSPLPQLYSAIVPDSQLKPKWNNSREVDECRVGTPVSLCSDITSPQTPALSDTSSSTPTPRGAGVSQILTPSGLALLSAPLERPPKTHSRIEVKQEREDQVCRAGVLKVEVSGGVMTPGLSGDAGEPPSISCPPSTDLWSEDEDCHSGGVSQTKLQRCKRVAPLSKDKPKFKKSRRDEEDTDEHPPSHQRRQQLSVLPLMEPVLGSHLNLFMPYGTLTMDPDSRLVGSFGNASLNGVTDFYSELIYQQNNLSNPPTPPASLPPTPPPASPPSPAQTKVRQKMLNGFVSTEELSRRRQEDQDAACVSSVEHCRSIKTVDIPASLPTPPHNNQEDLRLQDAPGPNSPEGYVPSSSPESLADVEISRYPDLSFIKLEPPSPCPSPPIPFMPPACGKALAVKQEVKTEPNVPVASPCSNTDQVTIAITLTPAAAQNIPGVMASMAELLRVQVPLDCQLRRLGRTDRVDLQEAPGQASVTSRVQGPPRSTAVSLNHVQSQRCSNCKGTVGNEVCANKDQVFCSQICSSLYMSAGHKMAPLAVQHRYITNMTPIAAHSLPPTTPSPPAGATPPVSFPSASSITKETRPHLDSLKVTVKLKPRPRTVSGGEESLARHGKRTRGSCWKRWSVGITLTRGPCPPDQRVALPMEEEIDVLLQKSGASLRPDLPPRDLRKCCFCHQHGDGPTDGPARLLNVDLDLWVHLNCALWSSEVYETQAGALINVELALRRGLALRCAHCQQSGATSGCNRLRCTNTYHFACALQAHCTFFKDKTMLCHQHRPWADPHSSNPGPDIGVCDPYNSELRCFSVFRRVYVQRDEARQIAALVQRSDRQHTFRVGAMLFRAVGRLLPHQMDAFHNHDAIFPVGFQTHRLYWSTRHCNRRCRYVCSVGEEDRLPVFRLTMVESGYDDITLSAPTAKDVWDQVLDPVARLRSSSGTLQLFPLFLKGEELFGLTTPAVCRIIESLPGVESCQRYNFRFGRNPLMEAPLAFNPSGSARSEARVGQAKRPYLLTSMAPRCQGSVGSIVGLVPGVLSLSPGESVAAAHQGRHSKSSQYRRMKVEWKSNVYLARSRIQGLGLYAARDLEKNTMVIEYIGAIIRSEVANRKERLYESQNRGVYMFRIDNDYVIDATIAGGPARYINHSCAPNCITEVVTVEKENKIIISSCRRIQRGEELSYDYKFDLEDDQHKIPCHCGAFNCRKWMN